MKTFFERVSKIYPWSMIENIDDKMIYYKFKDWDCKVLLSWYIEDVKETLIKVIQSNNKKKNRIKKYGYDPIKEEEMIWE